LYLATLMASLACTFAGNATAQPVATELERAESAYASMDYETARMIATKLSIQRGIHHDALLRITRLVMLTNAALGDRNQAEEAAIMLLMYDPGFSLGQGVSPKMREPMQVARMYWRDRGAVPGLEVRAVPSASQRSYLRVTTRDPSHVVRRVEVSFRWGTVGPFSKRVSALGKGVEVSLPTRPKGVLVLEYFAQGFDEHDNVVFENGSSHAPKTARVETAAPLAATTSVREKPLREEEGDSVFSSPVFWMVVGAVVVGGAAGTYFGTRPAEENVVPSNRAALGPTLICGGASCN